MILAALPSVGPVGLEPTTNGLKVLPRAEGSRVHGPAHDQDVTSLARHVLECAARGSVPSADLRELARAVLAERRVKLAQEVLQGGEWMLAAGLALAGEVLQGSREAALPDPVPALLGAVGAQRRR
jgi:hypothetical protein